MLSVVPAVPRGRGVARRPRRLPTTLLLLLLGGLLSACATPASRGGASTRVPGETDIGPPPRAFDQWRDTFAFANLVRAERPQLNNGFANYCLIMSRGASQFFRVARFVPAAPPLPSGDYVRLTREVLSATPWAEARPDSARIVIPGYPDLRTFSRAQESAIKAVFGSNVLSMLDWRTWRVGVAFSPAHQARLAEELVAEVDAGRPAPVMITNFPSEDILNHAVLVYGRRPLSPASEVLELLAYDPNDPESPLSLFFDRATRAFWIAPLTYSPPGRIRAFRLYTSLLF